MHSGSRFPLVAALLLGCASPQAQEAVVRAADPDALFHSSDPELNANKQVAYHIVKDLIEAGYWDPATRQLGMAPPDFLSN